MCVTTDPRIIRLLIDFLGFKLLVINNDVYSYIKLGSTTLMDHVNQVMEQKASYGFVVSQTQCPSRR